MNDSLSTDIVDAVASARNSDPRELDFVLADHVDPDALEQLAEHPGGTWTFTFELPGHSVTVTSDGTILVDGAAENDFSGA
ncbi:HalOD1 output domain-containing protein [Halosimplex halobium]|uniref:HalOD1 output domain-containing protein n=1 Tax=Halosimplex halobium TaxID=3396618 RepID=UPI003F544CC1